MREHRVAAAGAGEGACTTSRPGSRFSAASRLQVVPRSALFATVPVERERWRPRERWSFAAILVVALAVRVAAIVVTGPTTLRFGDAADYVATAETLCRDGRYPDRGSLPFFRAPGLPVFLTAVTLCRPGDVVAAKLALALCDVATTALVALLVLLLFGASARRAAFLAAGLAAIDPFLTLASSDVTTEPLATVLLTISLCALLAARGDHRATLLAAAGGAALGLACLTRPGSLAVAPAWLLPPACASASQRTTRERGIVVLAAALALAATLAPWTLRNWRHFGAPILVNDAGGYNAWRGTHPRLHAMLANTEPARFAEDSRVLEEDLARLAREQGLGSDASPAERDRRWWAAARAHLAEDPVRGARILARNALAFFRPWLDPAAYGWKTLTVSAAWFVTLGVLALGGLRALWRRDRATTLLLVAGVLLAGLAHVPFQTVLRFRLPFTEPLLLALAAVGTAAAISARTSAREARGRA